MAFVNLKIRDEQHIFVPPQLIGYSHYCSPHIIRLYQHKKLKQISEQWQQNIYIYTLKKHT